jgi:uncharacterized protein HemX
MFIITSIIAALTFFLGIVSSDILLGLIIIVIGIERIGVEIAHKKMLEKQSELSENLFYVSKGLEENFNVASDTKQKTNFRIHQLDKKRIEMERDLNLKYRDAVRKIIELENKINNLSKSLEKMKAKR